MTVAVSTDLGRVEELGVGLAAGTAAGMDVGTGSATDIRTDFGAAFERAGGSAALDQTLALPGNGTSEKLAIASVGSNARFAGSESFKANWQPMQRLWSGSAGSAGEPPEEVEGESDETKAGNETGGGLGGRSIGVALAFAGRAATQSTLAASWRNGSTANAALSSKNPARANPPRQATNRLSVAAVTQSATALSTTKTFGVSASSRAVSETEGRNNSTRVAEEQGQGAQAATGAAGSTVEGYAAQAGALLQANLPSAILSGCAPPGLANGGGAEAAPVGQPAPGPAMVLSRAKGALSGALAATATNTAATNSSAGGRGAGPLPTHPAQTLPGNQAINAGATNGVGAPDGEQEEFASLSQDSLPSAPLVAGGVSKAKPLGTYPGIEEPRTLVQESAAHRGSSVTGGTSAGQRTPVTAAESPSASPAAESQQRSQALTTHEAASAGVNSAISQPIGQHVAAARSVGMETSALVRDPAGAQGSANTPATIGSTATSPAPAPQETFAALDAGSAVGAPNWVHAGGRQAEAGFEDPALGWVGVRADLSGGSVHAAVVPGSTEAAQALSGHLAGLSTYLSENHTPVATLTMAAPGNSGIEARLDQSLGQGMGQGMQQSSGQHGEETQGPALHVGSKWGAGASAAVSSANSETQTNGFDAMAYARDGRGTHISVMA